ncbi:MAG: formimidoylglutamase [Balneolaceae bacterium]
MNVSNINTDFYEVTNPDEWQGRVDSVTDLDQFRYHQVVHCTDINHVKDEFELALLGFSSDEGVKRNQGRTGAAGGPAAFRKAISSLCWQGEESGFQDVGNIFVPDGRLEEAQLELGKAVHYLLGNGIKPFIIGGGHETAYGHFSGIASFLMETNPEAKLGILNIDAHFDLRPHNGIPHSGSPFLQAFEYAQQEDFDLDYFVYGINPANNTKSLFRTAEELGVGFCTNREIQDKEEESLNRVESFLRSRTHIYLTVCLDVFKASIVPGVSAPAWNGIELQHALRVFDLVKKSDKMLSMDICELNPSLDQDQKTAKLAGSLFSEWLS